MKNVFILLLTCSLSLGLINCGGAEKTQSNINASDTPAIVEEVKEEPVKEVIIVDNNETFLATIKSTMPESMRSISDIDYDKESNIITIKVRFSDTMTWNQFCEALIYDLTYMDGEVYSKHLELVTAATNLSSTFENGRKQMGATATVHLMYVTADDMVLVNCVNGELFADVVTNALNEVMGSN